MLQVRKAAKSTYDNKYERYRYRNIYCKHIKFELLYIAEI